jgi:hypothetical protein
MNISTTNAQSGTSARPTAGQTALPLRGCVEEKRQLLTIETQIEIGGNRKSDQIRSMKVDRQ